MEDIIKLIVDNGISVVICGAFLSYIFKQQGQNEKVVEALTEITTNLALINEKLGIKLEKDKKKEK